MVNLNGYKTLVPYYLARPGKFKEGHANVFSGIFWEKVAIIIDCFEIFLDRPTNLQARAFTWSNYKHKNTTKVLIGIVPQ